jgi:hypothetical protein
MGVIPMSQKERERLELFAQVRKQTLNLVEVAALLPLSYRQCKRVWKRYQAEGDRGLVHRLRGRPSTHRKPDKDRRQALALVREHYADFGPTLAAEMLAKHHALALDSETLRRWLIADGHWQRHRRRSPHRQRRERKAHAGELVQIDGSHHDWFEERGPQCVLMVMIDDATNRTYARFYEAEDTRAAFDVFGRYHDRYGLPQALYPDQDSIYQVNMVECAAGTPRPLTQFGRAMQTLGVRVQCAHSPQAKGRVERRHQVFQDRLVKELRLAGINTLAAANDYLEKHFLPDLNARVIVTAASATDLHRKLPRGLRLEEALCWEETRVVARDWTLSWQGRSYQIDKRHAALSLVGRRVVVRELMDGRRQILHRGVKLTWRELAAPPVAPLAQDEPALKLVVTAVVRKPATDHPWRRWGIAASAATRRAGPSAPATDRVSLKEGSPPDVVGESGRLGDRLAIRTRHKKLGRNAVNVGGCGGRGRRRG